jgi:small ligand-binding sensory domain FIST
MPFAAALSEHPEATHAIGEVIGQVTERLGGRRPDLAVLFATPPHLDAFAQMCATVRTLLDPACLLGATAVAVLGGPREVEAQPAVSLWAASGIGPVTPVRLETLTTSSGTMISGFPPLDPPADAPADPSADLPDDLLADLPADGDDALEAVLAGAATDAAAGRQPGSPASARQRVLLLLPDPFTFPADAFLAHLAERHPEVTALGGLASAAGRPGGNQLVLDDGVHRDGAVGALLPPGVAVTTVVSQGCRPIGRPFTVTRAEGQMLQELAGQPALQRLQEIVGELSPADRQLLSAGVHLGRVIDEHKVDFARGDFLIRAVMGAEQATGALAVGDEVEVGATVQFQVRDAASADEDLRALLSGHRADGALVFTCNGRGVGLFGDPDHDAALVSELVGTAALGGMFCAGEVGPVGGRNFLHGYTASVALFSERGAGQ